MFARTQTLTCSPRARRASSLLSRIGMAFAVSRQRRALAQLDDAMLEDIGLTRSEAHREAERPAWDAPRHWML